MSLMKKIVLTILLAAVFISGIILRFNNLHDNFQRSPFGLLNIAFISEAV